MSGKAVGWVLDNSPYVGTQRLIHVVIADVSNEENGNRLWCSQQRIATKCKCDRKTVNACLSTMVADGYLKLITDNSSHRKPNVYEFMMPTLGESDPMPTTRVISSPTRVISGSALGESRPSLGVRFPSNVIELKEEQKNNSTAFDEFWAAYPRKVAKEAARKAFELAARRGSPEKILEAAAVQCAAWKSDGVEQQFIPHPTTWLNQSRWNDAPDRRQGSSTLKGNAQFGKDYLPFKWETDDELLEGLGCKVFKS